MPLIPTVIEKEGQIKDSQNNPKDFWFKKIAGQEGGWSPITWQGWLVEIGYFVLIVANIFIITIPLKREIVMPIFIFILVLLTVSYLYIKRKKGEK